MPQLVRRAGPTECKIYDGARDDAHKIGNKRWLYVATRKIGDEVFQFIWVPIPRSAAKAMREPTEDFCREFWENFVTQEEQMTQGGWLDDQ